MTKKTKATKRAEQRAEIITAMRSEDYSIEEIANILKMSRGGVESIIRRYNMQKPIRTVKCECCGKEFETRTHNKKFCCTEHERIATRERSRHNKNADESNAIETLSKHNTDWEYIGGYTGSEGSMVIRHKCGFTTRKSCETIRHKGKLKCLLCEQKEKEERTKNKEIEKKKKQLEQTKRREVTQFYKPARNYQIQSAKSCAICGGFFIGRGKYCCSECSQEYQKHYMNMKKSKRRKKSFTDESKTISLKKLYERDHGTCWICGGQCDYEADPNSNEYPSIDHVKPICEGGKDSWNNIKLAHRICNSLRYSESLKTKRVYIPV